MFLSGPGVSTFPSTLMNYIEYNYDPTVLLYLYFNGSNGYYHGHCRPYTGDRSSSKISYRLLQVLVRQIKEKMKNGIYEFKGH